MTILRRNNMQNILKVTSLFMLASGSIPFLYFFRFVDAGASFNLLLLGVGLISVSIILAITTVDSSSSNIHFVAILYFQTLLLFTVYRIRFDSFVGDSLMEFRSARTTLEQGMWLFVRSSWERYFSSISVSITPAIVSEITGLDLLTLFMYGYRIVLAMLPVLLFRTVHEVFDEPKLAAVASVIFSQLYFIFLKLQTLIRQQVAEIFLILTVLVLIRQYKTKKNYKSHVFLLFIFIFSFISSHYTINYFSLAIFVGIFVFSLVLSYLPNKMLRLLRSELPYKKIIVNNSTLVLLLVLSLLWWSTVNLPNLKVDFTREIDVILGKRGSKTQHFMVRFAYSENPLGPIVTAWFDLELVLAVIGAVYLIFGVKKDEKKIAWIAAGLTVMAIGSLWIIPEQSAAGVYVDRLYIIGSLFFTSFSAAFLLRLWKNRYLKALFFAFLLLNLPMNMVLPVYYKFPYYTREAELPPEEVFRRESSSMDAEFAMQVWADTYARDSRILVGKYRSMIDHFYIRASRVPTKFPFSNETYDYMIINHFALLYGLWKTAELSFRVMNFTEILTRSAVVYNNGQAVFISSKI